MATPAPLTNRPAPERDEHAVDVDEGERSRDAGWRLDVRHVHIGELREAGQHPPVAAEMAGHAGRVSTEQERLASRRSQVFVKVGRLAWPPLSQIGSLIVNLAVKTYLVIV